MSDNNTIKQIFYIKNLNPVYSTICTNEKCNKKIVSTGPENIPYKCVCGTIIKGNNVKFSNKKYL